MSEQAYLEAYINWKSGLTSDDYPDIFEKLDRLDRAELAILDGEPPKVLKAIIMQLEDIE